MKEVVLIEKDEFEYLPIRIVEAIIASSKRPYGFKMISRETGKELDRDTIIGLLMPSLRNALERSGQTEK